MLSMPFFGPGSFILAQLQFINARMRSLGLSFGGARRGRVQFGRATNQSIIVGNYATVYTGDQSANPVNVG